MLAYSTACSELAFESAGFEKRLREVADYLVKQLIANYSKAKSEKIPVQLISAAMLYATCSNNTEVTFKNKKATNGRFATLSTAASQFELSEDDLKKFVKQIF